MKHVILFGGSFNPIHNGHLAIARKVIKMAQCDEVWLMVSPQNPLKEQQGLMNVTTRFLLAQSAVQGEKGIFASDFELTLPQPSYTYTTLKCLKEKYPLNNFSILIGADNWQQFDKWYKGKEIIQNHKIFIYPRKGFILGPTPSSVQVIDAPLFPISSTEIRKLIAEGQDISQWVPPCVANWAHKQQGYPTKLF